MNRREFLAGGSTIGVTVGMAGCLSRLPFVGGESDGDNEDNEDAGEATDEESPEDGPTDTDDQQGDESDAQEQERDAEQDQDEGQDNTDEQDEQQERPEGDGQPDEEDYEVDDEEFEGEPAEQRDVEELGADAISIDASAQQNEQGTVTITGHVTNEAEQTLTADLDILCYNENDEYIGATLITVRNIAAGNSKEFTAEIGPDELQGELASIRVEPTVYATG